MSNKHRNRFLITMKKQKNNLTGYLAIDYSLFFIFCIFFNGYNERFADTFVQIIRYAILIGLIAAKILLLLNRI